MEKKRILFTLTLGAFLLGMASCGGGSSSTSQGENSISQTGEGTSSQGGGEHTSEDTSHGGGGSSTTSTTSSTQQTGEDVGKEMPITQNVVVMCAKNTGFNRVYAWVDDAHIITKGWPGDAMDSYDAYWYTYAFENAPEEFNVIFNGSSGQTADLKGIIKGAGYYWFTKEKGLFPSSTIPESGGLPEGGGEGSGNIPVIPQTPEVQTIDGPGSYTGGVDSASDYTSFSFWNSYPSSYWTTVNKYNGNRKDFRQESIYFAITTRFYNGDSDNDAYCWDNKHNPAEDPTWRGDFKGLIEKMDYIKALGFTAIWITPIVTNASGYDYHGYHGLDFQSVDTRYLSEDVTFQSVINEAHRRDMKIVLDVVFNHTGNFGDETLFPMFIKDRSANPDDHNGSMKLNKNGPLAKKYPNYASMTAGEQYDARIKTMKSSDGDPDDIYHHYGHFSWETQGEQVAQIAGDCVDLNTENPKVAEYLVDSYGKFIRMGVDAFRIDTMKHINRLTLNKYFFPALREYAKKCRGDDNFFMFGEVCARVTELYNHGIPSLSPSFYTWKEERNYAWGDKETNYASAEKHYNDYREGSSDTRTTNNAYLNGMSYHTPDLSQWNGNSVIDFRMHRSFERINEAYDHAVSDDGHFVDATYNVVYVDSHDYAPEPQDLIRPSYSDEEWAEKMNLMFTFRGIPCLYYGTEVKLGAGNEIDVGPNKPLSQTGRAYLGDHLEGSLSVSKFGEYGSASGKIKDTLSTNLSKHLMMLNKIRQAVPALQLGQYKSFGNKAFVRRYTAGGVDSVAVVAINGTCSFSGLPNGQYVDMVTGDVKNGTSFTVSAEGQGNLRVYVLNGNKIGGSPLAK